MRAIELRWVGKYDEAIITVEYERRRFPLFGRKWIEHKLYRGSGTVWHEWPSGKRCSTSLELYLSDVWIAERWKLHDAQHGPRDGWNRLELKLGN